MNDFTMVQGHKLISSARPATAEALVSIVLEDGVLTVKLRSSSSELKPGCKKKRIRVVRERIVVCKPRGDVWTTQMEMRFTDGVMTKMINVGAGTNK